MQRRQILKLLGATGIAALSGKEALAFRDDPDAIVSLRSVLPKPFVLLNIAGQTIFPWYAWDGRPTCRAVAYLFPDEEEIHKLGGLPLAEPPMSGHVLCSCNGARYAAISVPIGCDQNRLNSLALKAVADLNKFKQTTPGTAIHYWLMRPDGEQ